MKFAAGLLAALLFAAPGWGQVPPPSPPPTSIISASTTPISASNVSSNVQLPNAAAGAYIAQLYNAGTKDAFCRHGPTNAVAALTTDIRVPATLSVPMYVGTDRYVACITSGADTTTIDVWQSNGVIQLSKSGSGSGSGVTSFNTRTGAVTLQSSDVSGVGGLLASNNLSDLANAGTSRTNLGVPTGTSGAVLGFLNGTNTIGGVWTFPAGDFVLGTAVNGDIGTFNASHALIDSGTLLSSLAPLISPSFTTPTLGVASATTINKLTITPPATGSTLTIADGKTFIDNNNLTLSGTDGSTLNIGGGGTLGSLAFLSSINNSNWSGTGLALTNLAAQATNTVVANVTSGSATPTAFSMPSCSAATCALGWTTNTGFTTNSSINAATLGGATFAAPGAIGGTTPGAGSFSALTMTGNIAAGGNNINLAGNITGNSASGFQVGPGNATATNPTLIPNKADATTGGGGATGHFSLIGGGTQVVDITSGGTFLKVITTGTNADFICMAAGGLLQLQTSACTISSKRFKDLLHRFFGDATGLLSRLEVWKFKVRLPNKWVYNNKIKKWVIWQNPDKNAYNPQFGLIAENVAEVMPECAIYEKDMQTPKSYRQECVLAIVVAAEQEKQREIELLFMFCLSLSIWCVWLTLRKRK